MPKILLAEDDLQLVGTITELLHSENFTVDTTPSGADALERASYFEYELIILDWGLSELSGLEALIKLRARGCNTPVLMLTAKNTIDDKEQGLEAGADDYLSKPFHPRELRARLRALLRRPPQMVERRLVVRDITLESANRTVMKGETVVMLQRLEFDLLEFLMRHPGEVFGVETLLRRVWDSDCDVSLYALYTCIKKLRKKLDSNGTPSIIRTVHGVGYALGQ